MTTATGDAAETLPRWDLDSIFPGPESPEFRKAADRASHAIAELTALFDRLGIGTRPMGPIDANAIVALAERTGRIVTAEDHSIIGGLGSAVAEVLGERRPTPMRRIGLRDVYGESAPNDYLIEAYGISAGHVAAAVREVLDRA